MLKPPTSCAKIESKHLASSKRPNAKCCDETGLANSQKGPILCRDSKWWHTPLQLLLCRMHDMTSKILTFGALHQIEHCLPWPRRTINHRSHCFDDMHRHLVLLSQSQSCRGCGHPCQGVRWFFHWKLDIIYIYYRYACMNFLESTDIAGLHGWWAAFNRFSTVMVQMDNHQSVICLTYNNLTTVWVGQWPVKCSQFTKNYSYPPTSSHIIPYHPPYILIYI